MTKHSVQWIDAGRDEPPSNGYWRCVCGKTFAPDGVDEYVSHLPNYERLLQAVDDALEAESRFRGATRDTFYDRLPPFIHAMRQLDGARDQLRQAMPA